MTRDRSSAYTTELIKVAGIVSESIELLRIWQPGMRAAQLRDLAIQEGSLAKESSDRVWVMVLYGFGLRYLGEGQRPARLLKHLVDANASVGLLRQLFSIYTARINGLFADAASELYWELAAQSVTELLREQLLSYIGSKVGTPKLPKAWSEQAAGRVASGLLKTFVDFGYAAQGRGVSRPLTPPRMLPQTAAFIAYEARERGIPDSAICDERAFALFGLDRHGALGELAGISGRGYLIAQSAGDLVRVSFIFKTMEEFLDAVAH